MPQSDADQSKVHTPQSFVSEVIEPVLCRLNDQIPFSADAVRLLTATALHESDGLRVRHQVGGPALSYFQVEPATHDDIWKNFLNARPDLAQVIKLLLADRDADDARRLYELEYNDNYATGIARLKYFRAPGSLPPASDFDGIVKYWSQKYQTSGSPQKEALFRTHWQQYNGENLVYKTDCT
jgi:hypothetical protein